MQDHHGDGDEVSFPNCCRTFHLMGILGRMPDDQHDEKSSPPVSAPAEADTTCEVAKRPQPRRRARRSEGALSVAPLPISNSTADTLKVGDEPGARAWRPCEVRKGPNVLIFATRRRW